MSINGLDDTDRKIIELLKADARMSYSEIGDEVGLSRVAVKNRITALEDSGVIKGYYTVINDINVPGQMIFICFLETLPEAFDSVMEKLKSEGAVQYLCQITGDCSIHAVCVATSLDEMKAFVKRVRSETTGIIRFIAHSVIDVAKGSILPN